MKIIAHKWNIFFIVCLVSSQFAYSLGDVAAPVAPKQDAVVLKVKNLCENFSKLTSTVKDYNDNSVKAWFDNPEEVVHKEAKIHKSVASIVTKKRARLDADKSLYKQLLVAINHRIPITIDKLILPFISKYLCTKSPTNVTYVVPGAVVVNNPKIQQFNNMSDPVNAGFFTLKINPSNSECFHRCFDAINPFNKDNLKNIKYENSQIDRDMFPDKDELTNIPDMILDAANVTRVVMAKFSSGGGDQYELCTPEASRLLIAHNTTLNIEYVFVLPQHPLS